MNIKEYEKDLIIEALEYRLENDDELIHQVTLKEEIEDLLFKLEDE